MFGSEPGEQPLTGRRLIVTRPREQAAGLVRALEELGAEVLALPAIRISDPADPRLLEDACRDADHFDWIVFTSVNGVDRFWRTLTRVGRTGAALDGVRVCAIGTATATALEERGRVPDLVPERFVAEAIVEALNARERLIGKRVLLPRAEQAREVLPRLLRKAGAEVEDVPAYRTVSDHSAAAEMRAQLASGSVDLVVFMSGSAVRSVEEMAAGELRRVAIASIGPITSAVAAERGLAVAVEAAVHTAEGLVIAIREYFS